MKIVRCIAGLICLCTLFMFPSCNKSTVTPQLGNWVGQADFPGSPRSGAFCFTIGNTAYIGGGFHGGNSGLQYINTFYSFDQEGNIWTQIAPFPGTPREKAVAFSINGKGYVGTGYNRAQDSVTFIPLKDFWEYDPAVNQWKQLNDFGGGARFEAVAFAASGHGYVGTGFDGNEYFGDFWRYDPADDSWHNAPTYPGSKVHQAVIMPIDDKFYLLSGYSNSNFVLKMWQFDPANGLWSSATPAFTDAQYGNFKAAVSRIDAVAFGLNGMGYIALGNAGNITNTVYQYDPVGLTWTKMTPYERAPRTQAIAYVVGGRAFVGTGYNGSINRFDNVDEFLPLADYDIND